MSVAVVEDDFLDAEDIPNLGGLSDFEKHKYEKQIQELNQKLKDRDRATMILVQEAKEEADEKILQEQKIIEEERKNFDKATASMQRAILEREARISQLTERLETAEGLLKSVEDGKVEEMYRVIEDRIAEVNKDTAVLNRTYGIYHYCLLYLGFFLKRVCPRDVTTCLIDVREREILPTIRKLLAAPVLPVDGERPISGNDITEKEVIEYLAEKFNVSQTVGSGKVPEYMTGGPVTL